MKLLYITNGIKGAGGLERVLAVKASYLADVMNYEVHILVLNNNNAKPFYEFSSKIKVHDIAVFGNPIAYLNCYISGIKNVVSEIKPNVISVCDDGLKGFFIPKILDNSYSIIYERHVSKNIIFSSNDGVFNLIKAKIQLKLMDVLASKFDKFIVLTNENKKEWHGKNVEVISNPLSFYPNEKALLINKKVIAVGKQSYQKGYDRLLTAWEKVLKNHPDWQLEIYGKLDLAQKLNEQVSDLKIVENVHFFPPEKNIIAKYFDSSIYVMSSRFEGFGMVLIEAMACGVPCVSFDCPYGPSDIIRNNEDGFIVENGNTEALAEKLEVLIENEELRNAMGKLAKENVKRFLPEVIMKQWDELFKSLIN